MKIGVHLLRVTSFIWLVFSTCFAEVKEIDLRKADSLVLWKSLETLEVGAVTATSSHVLYSAINPELYLQYRATEQGEKRFPNQDQMLNLLRRSHLKCRDALTGKLVWQAAMEFGGDRKHYLSGLPPMSAPSVKEGRVFVQTAEAQVMAFDLAGLTDGKNDGPFRWEQNFASDAADLLWIKDLRADLKVVPRNVGDVGAQIAQPLVAGQMVYCVTGNAGVHQTGEDDVRNLSAPSFLALSALDGSVLWQNNEASAHCDCFQNASPFMVSADGSPKTIGFPGGDGQLYLLDAKTGKTQARLPCFTKESKPWTKDLAGTRNFFSIAPTIALPYIITCPGRMIESGGATNERRTPIFAYKMTNEREAELAWIYDEPTFSGSFCPMLVSQDKLYILALRNKLMVLDLVSGKNRQTVELPTECLGNAGMTLWGDKLVVCLEDGLYIFSNETDLTLIAHLHCGETASIFSQPIIHGNTLYVSMSTSVWAIGLEALSKLLEK